MRDFRDAKAMAQTLRQALNAKSISLTYASSLELIAKILGFRDWNVLAARIKSDRKLPAAPARQEIAVNPASLDDYVGFYRLNDNAVLAVMREGTQLSAQLTGQPAIPIYPESRTEFFYKAVDAQISFVTAAHGPATSLILHQGGVDVPMARIDAGAAQQIVRKTAEKVRSQSANPGTEAALRRLIEGIAAGKPRYDEMVVALADATRDQMPGLQPGLAALGAVQSIRFLGVGPAGEDVYTVRHENGASHWRIALDSSGKIATALVTPGP